MEKLLILLFIIFPFTLFSHGSEDHSKKKTTVTIKKEHLSPKEPHDSKVNPIPLKEGSSASKNSHAPKKTNANEQKIMAIQKINNTYQKSVRSIFADNCFNCHSNTVEYPWYYKLPLVKQLIDRDIEEAREHLDMSKGFPFDGHGSPTDDLKILREAVQEESMPPMRYTLLHRDSILTKKEKQQILGWIEKSQERLTHKKEVK
ncbi:MAG: heme-binding domain-containing protein [SAR324 cluster bacterium]|nr:heme-binding domain-containing protein [SAR324 cluster bacterium]